MNENSAPPPECFQLRDSREVFTAREADAIAERDRLRAEIEQLRAEVAELRARVSPCMECDRDTAADWREANQMVLRMFTDAAGIDVTWDAAAHVFVGHVRGTEIRSQGRNQLEAIRATADALRLMLRVSKDAEIERLRVLTDSLSRGVEAKDREITRLRILIEKNGGA